MKIKIKYNRNWCVINKNNNLSRILIWLLIQFQVTAAPNNFKIVNKMMNLTIKIKKMFNRKNQKLNKINFMQNKAENGKKNILAN